MAEIVSNCIISKIISYVNTEINNRKVGYCIRDYCYSFMKNMIVQGLKEYHMSYDQDDYNYKVKGKQCKKLNNSCNSSKTETNTWVEINEPVTNYYLFLK